MIPGEEFLCEFCEKRQFRRMERMAFRQWSDKGYLHCQVTMMVGVCNNCKAVSLAPGADRIFDEAFQREYENRP